MLEAPSRIDRWLGAREFAEAMGISHKHLYVIARDDPEFPKGFYLGRRRLWRESEIAAYLDIKADQASRKAEELPNQVDP